MMRVVKHIHLAEIQLQCRSHDTSSLLFHFHRRPFNVWMTIGYFLSSKIVIFLFLFFSFSF